MSLKYYIVAGTYRKLSSKIFILLFAILPLFSMAQDDLSKVVQVTKAYDPIISDAEKIDFPLNFNDSLLNIRSKFQYSITPHSVASSVIVRPMPSAKINENAYKDPKWLYARAGAGYPLQLQGDLYLQNLYPADYSYGMFYNHRSIWSKINNPNGKDVPIDEMNHQVGVFFRKNGEKLSFNINGGFFGHNVQFYGYNTTTAMRAAITPLKDSIAQVYKSVYVNAGLNSQDTKESDFRYHVNLMAEFFGDNGKNKFNKGRIFSMDENKLGAEIILGYAIERKKHLISLKAEGDMFLRNLKYNNMYDPYFADPMLIYNSIFNDLYGIAGTGKDIKDDRYIFSLTPSYTYSSAKIDLDLGFKYTGYKKSYSMNHRIYPVANIIFKVGSGFNPYANISGEVKMNDYRSIVDENPYISPGMNMTMKATDSPYAVSVGIRGNVENVFAYNIYGKYSALKDLYFFVNSEQTLPVTLVALKNNFDVVYDDARQLSAVADLKVSSGFFEATLSGAYYSYTLDKLGAAFHRPEFVANLDINMKASKSLVFNINACAGSKTPYTGTANGEIYYNDEFINLGAGAEYMFTRSFSIFLNASNLLNRKNEVWHGYKLPGTGVLGGITFKF